ncbi:MAG: type II toxin-antitoxin system RatA family toxin [Cellvibrionaceae bacterium]|nr:type II toxin-antitoxin system RatA family toxin [Cellvibrionaceae bacterium]MCV6625316.1 type II toxin-antitoxin system RatA family toxin [Cellvibrionaceae bacterium]
MQHIERSALVAYSQEQMFNLIGDIESYPEYMDGCIGATVRQREDNFVVASLTLSRAGIKQSFTTRNTLRAPDLMVMELVEGPFSEFQGFWGFEALSPTACKVMLQLAFSFDNPVVQGAGGKLFESVANQQVASLCRRAEQVYGKPQLL